MNAALLRKMARAAFCAVMRRRVQDIETLNPDGALSWLLDKAADRAPPSNAYNNAGAANDSSGTRQNCRRGR